MQHTILAEKLFLKEQINFKNEKTSYYTDRFSFAFMF